MYIYIYNLLFLTIIYHHFFSNNSLTNVKEKKKWNNSKIFDKTITSNVDYSLIRDDGNEDELPTKNKNSGIFRSLIILKSFK